MNRIRNGLRSVAALFRDMRMRNKLLSLTVIVLLGLTSSFVTGLVLINQVRIGSHQYDKIKANREVLEQIALLSSKLNNFRAEMAIVIDEVDKDKASRIRENMTGLRSAIDQGFDGLLSLIASEEKKVTVLDAQKTWAEFVE